MKFDLQFSPLNVIVISHMIEHSKSARCQSIFIRNILDFRIGLCHVSMESHRLHPPEDGSGLMISRRRFHTIAWVSNMGIKYGFMPRISYHIGLSWITETNGELPMSLYVVHSKRTDTWFRSGSAQIG